jgi:hypothetical protein
MLSFGSTSPVNIAGASAGTATLTITTTAVTTAGPFAYPVHPGVRWYGMGLALVLLVGAPALGRSGRTRLGILIFLMIFICSFMACGGSGSTEGGGSSNPGTTPGAYTVTVTGTAGSTVATSTVALIVQ